MFRAKKRGNFSRLFLLLILTALIIFGIIMYINIKLNPLIKPIALSNARNLATRYINEIILEKMSKLDISYDKLIKFDKDNNNRITILRANTVELNELQAKLSLAVIEKIEALENTNIKIPMGNLVNSGLFSNRGPRITIKLLPVGHTQSNIKSKFSAGGINQTKHEIILEVKTIIGAVLPTSTEYVEVVTYVTIAESVIVGEVPQSYTNINGDKSDVIGMVNDYVEK